MENESKKKIEKDERNETLKNKTQQSTMRKNHRSETKYIAGKRERKEGRKKGGEYGRR